MMRRTFSTCSKHHQEMLLQSAQVPFPVSSCLPNISALSHCTSTAGTESISVTITEQKCFRADYGDDVPSEIVFSWHWQIGTGPFGCCSWLGIVGLRWISAQAQGCGVVPLSSVKENVCAGILITHRKQKVISQQLMHQCIITPSSF